MRKLRFRDFALGSASRAGWGAVTDKLSGRAIRDACVAGIEPACGFAAAGFVLWDGSRLPTSTEPLTTGSHAEPRRTAQNGRVDIGEQLDRTRNGTRRVLASTI